jgi:hypothetical protein
MPAPAGGAGIFVCAFADDTIETATKPVCLRDANVLK